MKNILYDQSRLKWACRRGMLELDVLLGNFLEEAYFQLAMPDQQQFIRLLDSADPDLFRWLMGDEPSDPELARITEIIREYTRSRFSTETV